MNDEVWNNINYFAASWRWEEFSSPILFTGMLIFAVVLKIVFHHIHVLEKILPESCVLIVVGSICGLFIDKVLLHHTSEKRFQEFPQFTANLFFNILLPPIIFDSALSLANKEFLSTFVSVVVFAVFGTLFNVFTVGYSLYGLSERKSLTSNETPLKFHVKWIKWFPIFTSSCGQEPLWQCF